MKILKDILTYAYRGSGKYVLILGYGEVVNAWPSTWMSIVLATLFMTSPVNAALISSSTVYVIRQQKLSNFETYSIRLGVTFSATDLTLGTSSHATFRGPAGEFVNLSFGSVRGGSVSFAITFPLETVADADGIWAVTINNGVQVHENLEIVVPVLNGTHFPSYPPFPTPAYLGNPFDVFASLITNGAGAYAGSSGYQSNFPVTNGSVFRFPAGGPFQVTAGRSISLPTITIRTSAGQFLTYASDTSAKSERVILVHSGSEIHPFAGRCDLVADRVTYEVSGLSPGKNYTLQRTSGLSLWESVFTFNSPSNVFRHQEDFLPSGRFFRLVESE
ncbi:MAG: hypothetical protein ABI600_04435 [Luteolibacter sp.]